MPKRASQEACADPAAPALPWIAQSACRAAPSLPTTSWATTKTVRHAAYAWMMLWGPCACVCNVPDYFSLSLQASRS